MLHVSEHESLQLSVQTVSVVASEVVPSVTIRDTLDNSPAHSAPAVFLAYIQEVHIRSVAASSHSRKYYSRIYTGIVQSLLQKFEIKSGFT